MQMRKFLHTHTHTLTHAHAHAHTHTHLLGVATLLHGDDAHLVLLVDPAEKVLLVVVEDAAGLWPVAVCTARLQEAVALLEQKVVGNKLLAVSLVHAIKGEVPAREKSTRQQQAQKQQAQKQQAQAPRDKRKCFRE